MNDRIRVGDRVRLNSLRNARVLEVIHQPNRYHTDPRGEYRVRLDNGDVIFTRSAVKIGEPEPLATGAAPSELPAANLQAATFAHNLLGDDAELDKLIGVAEFVMDRRTLGTETTGTIPLPPERFITGLAADGPRPGATVTPAVLPSTERLVITDRDGDKFTVSHFGGHHETLAKVYVRSASDNTQRAVYLTEADVDAVITRLQAFKAQGFDQPF